MDFLNAQEIADLRLPEMPKTKKGVILMATRENWQGRKRQGRGGGMEYAISSMPIEIQNAIRHQQTARLLTQTEPELLPALSESVAGSLKTHDTDDLASSTQAQRNQAGARLGVLHKVEALMSETHVSKEAAITTLLTMAQHPSEFDPRKYLSKTVEAMKQICLARYQAFGCEGMADKIKPVSLEKMASKYAKGELNQIVK